MPVFIYARDRLPDGIALAMTIAYGLFWGMQQTAVFDVHEAAFAPLAVASLLLAMNRKAWRWFYVAAVAVATVKEDLTPFLSASAPICGFEASGGAAARRWSRALPPSW